MEKGNIVITGSTGSGKSYFLENSILKPLVKTANNIVIIDLKNQYEKVMGKKHDTFDTTNLRKDLEKYKREKRFRIRIIPQRGLPKRERDFIPNEVALFASKKGKMYVIVEEFNYYIRDKITIPVHFEDMLRLDTGAHNKDIYVIMVTQFPTDIPKDIWGNVQLKVFFHQNPKILQNLRNSSHINYEYTFRGERIPHPQGYQGEYYVE
jgi:DNA helicase HerA-like ATPase